MILRLTFWEKGKHISRRFPDIRGDRINDIYKASEHWTLIDSHVCRQQIQHGAADTRYNAWVLWLQPSKDIQKPAGHQGFQDINICLLPSRHQGVLYSTRHHAVLSLVLMEKSLSEALYYAHRETTKAARDSRQGLIKEKEKSMVEITPTALRSLT